MKPGMVKVEFTLCTTEQYDTPERKAFRLDDFASEEDLKKRFGNVPVKITEAVPYDLGRLPGIYIGNDAEGQMERIDLSETSDFTLTIQAMNIVEANKLRRQILSGRMKPIQRHADAQLSGWPS